MKIDIVTDTFAPDVNGVAMTLGRLGEGLRLRGHRVHVIRTGAGKCGETIAASMPLPGYREVRVGLPGPLRLRKRWLRRRPDVVYVATESPLGKSAVKAAKLLGIPVATGFHTNFHEYMGRYSLGGLQPMAMAYLKRFHGRADCTLAPSPELVEKLKAEGFREVHLLGRGVDTKLFDPAKRCAILRGSWGSRPGAPVAMVVGRVAAEKNLSLAIQAFSEMRTTVPDLQCVIVGDGPVRENLEAKHPWIHFAGVQTGEDLARHYASADILLFPSETETFGNVVLEGMASGLVTVCYDYAAAARFVKHGENGLKATEGDPDGFIAQAKAALSIRHGHGMRIAARGLAETQGWAQVVADFENRLGSITGSVASTRKQYARLPKNGKRGKVNLRTVFLSDIHLGTADSKAAEVVEFLKHIRCDKLVLNGDIIDGWALKRGSKWLPRHSRVIRKILKMSEKDKTEVIYLRGNHDDILGRFLPLAFGKIRFAKEHIHKAVNGKNYLVVHGDGFDSVSTNHRWLDSLGAVGYDSLLCVNRFYNKWRAWRGKEYFSLSKRVKAKVKSAVSFIDKYEQLLQELAHHRKCDGIICGHIHTPEDKQVGDIHYLNSGDWVESLTAIIEHHDGRMELVGFEDFMEQIPQAPGKPREIHRLQNGHSDGFGKGRHFGLERGAPLPLACHKPILQMSIRVFIIEDNAFLRETLAAVIGRLDGITLCGDAGSGEEAIEKMHGLQTDIFLVDGSLPGMSGVEFVKEMNARKPEIPCLFFSGRDDSNTVRAALEAGACGYVVKGGKPEELVFAISTCVGGDRYVSSSVVGWNAFPESSAGVS